MPCPYCRFPGNDPAATVCANCGTSLTLAYPGSPVAAYEVSPISPPSGPGSPPYSSPSGPVPPPYPSSSPGAGGPQYAAGGYGAGRYGPGAPMAGYPAGVPVSPTPISVTPISGGPQPEYYGPVKPARSRALVPLTVIVVVLVIASTV